MGVPAGMIRRAHGRRKWPRPARAPEAASRAPGRPLEPPERRRVARVRRDRHGPRPAAPDHLGVHEKAAHPDVGQEAAVAVPFLDSRLERHPPAPDQRLVEAARLLPATHRRDPAVRHLGSIEADVAHAFQPVAAYPHLDGVAVVHPDHDAREDTARDGGGRGHDGQDEQVSREDGEAHASTSACGGEEVNVPTSIRRSGRGCLSRVTPGARGRGRPRGRRAAGAGRGPGSGHSAAPSSPGRSRAGPARR